MRLTRMRADSRGTPTARGRQCRMSKKDNRRTRGSRKDRNKLKTHKSIWINKLGERWIYLKPVEQTLYSATVPIQKSGPLVLPLVFSHSIFFPKDLVRRSDCIPWMLAIIQSFVVLFCCESLSQHVIPSSFHPMCVNKKWVSMQAFEVAIKKHV